MLSNHLRINNIYTDLKYKSIISTAKSSNNAEHEREKENHNNNDKIKEKEENIILSKEDKIIEINKILYMPSLINTNILKCKLANLAS